eukprot:3381535-Pyramimonas_sp.AAC.1
MASGTRAWCNLLEIMASGTRASCIFTCPTPPPGIQTTRSGRGKNSGFSLVEQQLTVRKQKTGL